MSPRTGRPKAEQPKDVRIQIRLDRQTLERLDEFAKSHSKTRSEIIRKGIELVYREANREKE